VVSPEKEGAIEITYPDIYHPWFKRLDTATNGLTFLLTRDKRIFYYCGKSFSSTEQNAPELKETSFGDKNGVIDLLRSVDSFLILEMENLEKENVTNNLQDSIYKRRRNKIQADWRAKTIFVKADNNAKYGEFVTLIDILRRLKISKFVPLDITESENKLLQQALNSTK
jgi:biopolymer transport protein ExbD